MIEIIDVSFAFAWLRLASESIWPALILHTTHNSVIQGALDKLTIDTRNTEFFTTEFGLGLGIIGLAFWRLGKNLDLTKKVTGAV